jgi:hypothetical protein
MKQSLSQTLRESLVLYMARKPLQLGKNIFFVSMTINKLKSVNNIFKHMNYKLILSAAYVICLT